MPHYPSGYYGISTSSNYNNVVTRRLTVKDRVAFGPSTRFGGQYMEPKGVPAPYNGTIIDAQGAVSQLVNELNLIAPVFPELGTPVILSAVGVATNALRNSSGVGVSYIGAVTGNVTVDGVAFSTGLRVLYQGLSTAALNGVYTVSAAPYTLSRATDLQYWWHFVKPKAYVVTGGSTNKGTVYSLQTDAWEIGNSFTLAGTGINATLGTSITFTATSYDPTQPSGINASVLGPGAGNTSLINPIDYNPITGIGTAEYGFLAQAAMPKFIYLKNRARRMAYQIFKMRENFTPFVSSYQTNVITTIGLGNTQNNIGVSSANNLPAQSRYPSSFNRGF